MSAVAMAEQAGPEGRALAEAGIARIAVFSDFDAARPAWTALEAAGVGPGYQRIGYLEAWHRHLGRDAGVAPAIVAGFGAAGEPRFLWPFGRLRSGPVTSLEWMGAKHSNTNVGLYAADLAASVPAGFAEAAIAAARSQGLSFDLLRLANQPADFDGFRSPLLDLGGSVETDGLPRRRFGGEGGRGAEALVQGKPAKNAKRNWRRLNDMFGAVAVRRAEDAAMIGAWIDVFRAQKAERFAELGIADAFAPAGTREFLLAASDPSMPGGPVLEIHALLGGETVLAVAGIVAGRRRRSCVFLSDMAGTVKSMAPGVLMMNEMGIGAAAAGADSYDAGIGLQAYKMAICDTVDPVFETCRGYSPLGRLAVAAMQVKADAKRRVKQSPMLWSVVTRLRKLRSRDIRAEDRSAAAEEG